MRSIYIYIYRERERTKEGKEETYVCVASFFYLSGHYTIKSRDDSAVQTSKALLPQDAHETIQSILVFSALNTLHSCFDHFFWECVCVFNDTKIKNVFLKQ
jgi:hypothetical protein